MRGGGEMGPGKLGDKRKRAGANLQPVALMGPGPGEVNPVARGASGGGESGGGGGRLDV